MRTLNIEEDDVNGEYDHESRKSDFVQTFSGKADDNVDKGKQCIIISRHYHYPHKRSAVIHNVYFADPVVVKQLVGEEIGNDHNGTEHHRNSEKNGKDRSRCDLSEGACHLAYHVYVHGIIDKVKEGICGTPYTPESY